MTFLMNLVEAISGYFFTIGPHLFPYPQSYELGTKKKFVMFFFFFVTVNEHEINR